MKKPALLLIVLTISACAAREPRVVPQLHLPPPPADTSRAVGKPMIPELECLQKTGQLCPGRG